MFGSKETKNTPALIEETPVAKSPETTPATWLDMDPAQLQAGLANRQANRAALLRWVRDSLVEDTDFGKIHFVKKDKCPEMQSGQKCTNPFHHSKPSLWKAGAEKITGMLGLRVEWPNLLEELASLKSGARIITLRCVLVNQVGEVVSEGIGARSLDQDYNDINKSLKMAKKSGHIDAVLSAAGLSEVFTQDLGVAPEDADDPTTLNEQQVWELEDVAKELFADRAIAVLESLANRRFHIEDSDYRQIPAARFAHAIASLNQKAEQERNAAEKPVDERTRFQP